MRNLYHLNTAILFWQAWKMYSKPDLLASKLFREKHGENWFDKAVTPSIQPTALWSARGILRSVESMRNGLKRKLGNGCSIRIAEDKWLGPD